MGYQFVLMLFTFTNSYIYHQQIQLILWPYHFYNIRFFLFISNLIYVYSQQNLTTLLTDHFYNSFIFILNLFYLFLVYQRNQLILLLNLFDNNFIFIPAPFAICTYDQQIQSILLQYLNDDNLIFLLILFISTFDLQTQLIQRPFNFYYNFLYYITFLPQLEAKEYKIIHFIYILIVNTYPITFCKHEFINFYCILANEFYRKDFLFFYIKNLMSLSLKFFPYEKVKAYQSNWYMQKED